MLAKTKIEKNQKILKKLRQGVNISLERQVRPNIFNVNMFFSSRGYIGGLQNICCHGRWGGGGMLAHGLMVTSGFPQNTYMNT